MIEPTILYQDEDVLVVNKPAGLLVHDIASRGVKVAGQGSPEEETLAHWVAERFPHIAQVGEEVGSPDDEGMVARGGIVHRLDRDTSGVMIVAVNQQSFVRMKKQFMRHEIQKMYRAFVYGIVTDDRGLIDKPIGRAQGSGSRRSVRNAHGTLRESQTTFRTIARGRDAGVSGVAGAMTARASYLEVLPKTGRTHQIRVHLGFIHHPVLCDPLYAPGRPKLLGFERLALHAHTIFFKHPSSGKEVSFTAPLPPDFVEAQRRLTPEE